MHSAAPSRFDRAPRATKGLARSLTGAALAIAAFSLHSSSLPDPDFLDALWIAESGGLMKVDADSGNPLLRDTSLGQASAVAIDDRAGIVWLYRQGALVTLGMDGTKLREIPVPGLDPSAGLPPVVGQQSDWKANYCSGAAPIAPASVPGALWPFAELAADSVDGSAWLGLGQKLYRARLDGSIVLVRQLPELVTGVAVERQRGKIWVGQCRSVRAYARDDNSYEDVSLGSSTAEVVRDISFDNSHRSLWILQGISVRRFFVNGHAGLTTPAELPDESVYLDIAANEHGAAWVSRQDGQLRLVKSGPDRVVSPFEGAGITGLIANLRDGSAWVGSSSFVAHVSPEGLISRKMTLEYLGAEPTARLLAISNYADAIAPDLDVVVPIGGAYLGTQQPDIEIAFTDIGQGVDDATLQLSTSAGSLAASCSFAADRATCVPASNLPEGLIDLSATIADHAGNRSSPSSVQFVVDVTAPTIVVTSPTSGLVTNQPAQTVLGSVSEDADLVIDGQQIPLGAGLSFSQAVTLTEGLNQFLLVASDRAGNTSSSSVSVTLDTVVPGIPVTNLINLVKTAANVTVVGQAGSVEPRATVVIRNARTGAVVTVTAAANGSFSATIAADWNDELQIAVRDAAGNQSASISRSMPRLLSISQPLAGAIVKTDSVLVTGLLYASPESGVLVNGRVATLVPEGAALRFYAPIPLAEGSNTLTAVGNFEDGGAITQTVTVTRRLEAFQFSASPLVGAPGSVVSFSLFERQAAGRPYIVEFDFDGNHVPDKTVNWTSGPLIEVDKTFSTPGTYQAGVRVSRREIFWTVEVYRDVVPVVVVDPTAIEQFNRPLLGALWSKTLSALASGDINGTLAGLSYGSKEKYGSILTALHEHLPQIASHLSHVEVMEVNDQVGSGVVVTSRDGALGAFVVNFLRDEAGIWRIESM